MPTGEHDSYPTDQFTYMQALAMRELRRTFYCVRCGHRFADHYPGAVDLDGDPIVVCPIEADSI